MPEFILQKSCQSWQKIYDFIIALSCVCKRSFYIKYTFTCNNKGTNSKSIVESIVTTAPSILRFCLLGIVVTSVIHFTQ